MSEETRPWAMGDGFIDDFKKEWLPLIEGGYDDIEKFYKAAIDRMGLMESHYGTLLAAKDAELAELKDKLNRFRTLTVKEAGENLVRAFYSHTECDKALASLESDTLERIVATLESQKMYVPRNTRIWRVYSLAYGHAIRIIRSVSGATRAANKQGGPK